MSKQSKTLNRNAGFTIIEVLIVLAIVGLIMLIVFLAVPALNRNSRNTSTKSDVSNTLGGIAEYQGANNGQMPTAVNSSNGTVTYSGSGASTTIKIQPTATVTTNNALTSVPTTAPTSGAITVVIGKKCPATGNTGNLVTSPRSAAAIFSVETTGGAVVQCQET